MTTITTTTSAATFINESYTDTLSTTPNNTATKTSFPTTTNTTKTTSTTFAATTTTATTLMTTTKIACIGSDIPTACDGNLCQNAGTCTSWEDWSGCSKTCGNGMKTRQRTCYDGTCPETLSESVLCTGKGCGYEKTVSRKIIEF